MKKLIIMISVGLLLFACQSTNTIKNKPNSNVPNNDVPTNKVPPVKYIECKDPRPEVCTREYRPVCAKRDTGVRCVTVPCASTELVTKSTACVACSDKKVFGYSLGMCME